MYVCMVVPGVWWYQYICQFILYIVAGLVKKMDSLDKRFNNTTKMLMQAIQQVNIDCRGIVDNQTQFIDSKVSFG